MGAWNSHPLRTEINWSPWQIWVNGMISHDDISNTAVRDVFNDATPVDELYGIDPLGPAPNEFDLSTTVEVPNTAVPLSDVQLEAFSHIQPVALSNNYGVDFYLEMRRIVNELVVQNVN